MAQKELTQAAHRIVDSMRLLTIPKLTFRQIDENEFPDLLKVYREVRSDLEKRQFQYLGDHEIMEVSLKAGSLMQRTYIRSFIFEDKTIVVGFFRKRAHIGRLIKLLITGIINFRWIAAPRFFFKQVVPRNIFDVETEFSDGTFLSTSNAEGAALLTRPHTIDAEFHPVSTTVDVLINRHKERLASRLATSSAAPLTINSISEMLQMQERQRSQKVAYREALNLISKGELTAMSSNKTLADALFDEIRRVLSDRA